MKAKLKRLITSVLPVSNTRRGECINCGACCKLPKPCLFLRYHSNGESYCKIYAIRPPVCRKYPRSPSELLTADVCGYKFEADSSKTDSTDNSSTLLNPNQ